jgi:hypothetical protein
MGRELSDRDDLNSPLVTMIQESAAARLFGSTNLLGRAGRSGVSAPRRVAARFEPTLYPAVRHD